MSDPADLTALEAAAKIRDGEISSMDLVTACLKRIEEYDKGIRAWAYLDPEYALAAARHADEQSATGIGTGPLHGVPVGIKDIIDTNDMPTENGTPIDAGRQPRFDAAVVAALRDAGAIIMGKTVTTELASFEPGKTRNPRNQEHTPGGSSSGSAAAVASAMVPLALGTQTGGSVIRPASFCGVYALKPTFGLISRRGITMQSHSLDTVGLFARSIEDLALAADCLSAHDSADAQSYPRSRPSMLACARAPVPVAPTFAFIKTPAWLAAEPVTAEAFAEVVDHLGERCDEVALPDVFDKVLRWHKLVMAAENAAYYAPFAARAGKLLSARLTARLDAGSTITAKDYLAALAARDVLLAGIDEIFQRYDAVLTPAATGPAPKGLASTGDPAFNSMWTFLGLPAVTLPLLEAGGLPMGVQLVGPRRDDGRLLRSASWLVRQLSAAT